MPRCYNPFLYALPLGQVTTPMVYNESLSVLEQISIAYGKINQLDENMSSYLLISTFNEFVKNLEADQIEQDEELKDYSDTANERLRLWMLDQLAEISEGVLDWDVTTGAYAPSREAMRRLFNWLSVDALSIADLNDTNLTCLAVANSGLNCRGYATYNRELVTKFVPSNIHYQEGN